MIGPVAQLAEVMAARALGAGYALYCNGNEVTFGPVAQLVRARAS